MIAFRSPGAVLWPAQGWQRCRWSEGCRFIKDVQRKLKSHSWRCMPPNLQKPGEKKWWPCWILSERAKEGSRKSIWYAEMDWSLKWYTFHRKSHRGINRLSSQQKESCPAMAGSCGSFVFPGRGAFPIPGAEFWVIFIHMFWDIQFSLLIYWYDWSQAESCVSLCWLCLHMTIV